MALVFLLFNVTMAVLSSLALPAISQILERWLPADEQDDLSTPHFLFDEALDEPATAIDLIEHEQRGLARRLRGYIVAMRTLRGSPDRDKAQRIHAPFVAVASRVEQFQHNLANRQLGPVESARLARLQSRLSLLVYLEDTLRELFTAAGGIPATERLGGVIAQLIEGLDFVLLTMIEALDDDDGAVDLLTVITGDRSDLLEKIRQQFLANTAGVTDVERAALLHITSVFERATWMTQRMARIIGGGPSAQAIS
jgi:phosphate:Na+ symporter